MDRITIAGSQVMLTNTGVGYRVVQGHVLVFVVPLDPDTFVPLQRRLLYEAYAGCGIPALDEQHAGADGVLYHWTLLLVPLEPATLAPLADSEQLQQDFCAKLDVRLPPGDSFGESIAEFYNLSAVREMRNLYAAQKESENAARHTLDTMWGIFHRQSSLRRNAHLKRTGQQLYDAVACLCAWQRLPLVPLSTLSSGCGHSFTVQDIARVSKFAYRSIILEPGWHDGDSGPVLAYYGEQRRPVACIPTRPGHYLMWDPVEDTTVVLNDELVQQLQPSAVMFYRPLPEKPLDLQGLLRFALREVSMCDVLTILTVTLFGTLFGLLQALLSERLFNLFVPLGDAKNLAALCPVVISFALGWLAFAVVKGFAGFRTVSRIKYTVQAAVVERLFNLPESFLRRYDSADLAQRALSIPHTVELLAQTCIHTWLSAAFAIVYLWWMFHYSPTLSVHCLTVLACVILVIVVLGRRQLHAERQRLELEGRLSSLLNQMIVGIAKLRVSGAEDRALNQYMELFAQRTRLVRERSRCRRRAAVLTGASGTIFNVITFYQLIRGDLTLSVGTLMGFCSAFGSFAAAMLALTNSFFNVCAAVPVLKRAQPLLTTMPETCSGAQIPTDLAGSVTLNHVSFRYDDSAPLVLDDVSMEIRAGEYIGIVGASGCGKSTLLKLLLGLEKPTGGKIFYDDYDMDALDKREMRKKFGVVLQDGGLIPGSIAENIAITHPNATRRQVAAAARAAGLEADLAGMPMGLHTVLSEGDGTISGGQKQRILIARAIVGKPKLLFLDEATSALDNATQRTVCDNLEKLHCTRIVVAHRLSTIRSCDRIYVLSGGKIAESGTYDELMAKQGIFYGLARRQLT